MPVHHDSQVVNSPHGSVPPGSVNARTPYALALFETACNMPETSNSHPMRLRGLRCTRAAPDATNPHTTMPPNTSELADMSPSMPGRDSTSPAIEIGTVATRAIEIAARLQPTTLRVRSETAPTGTIPEV